MRKLTQRSSVRGRGHAHGLPERARKARFRRKPAIKRNLAERRASRRDQALRCFKPPLADVAMRRYRHGGRKCAAEMKDAEICDAREIGVGVSRHDRSASKAEFFGAPRRETTERTLRLPVFCPPTNENQRSVMSRSCGVMSRTCYYVMSILEGATTYAYVVESVS